MTMVNLCCLTSSQASKNIRGEKFRRQREDWELKQWATIGLFSFGNIAIFNDLDFSNWSSNPLEENEFLSNFVSGTPCNTIDDMGELDTEQDHEESKIDATEVPKLIADADSTQYAVIQKAIEGKSLVVQGPPGTGKSQTITNMVSCLLDKGKRVLFAADKLAALEVVKNKLKTKGLEISALKSTAQAPPN